MIINLSVSNKPSKQKYFVLDDVSNGTISANSTNNETATGTTTTDLPMTTWPNYCICPDEKIEDDDVTTNTTTPDGNSTITNSTTNSNNNVNITDDSSTSTDNTTTTKRRRRSLLEIEEFDNFFRFDLSSIGKRTKRGVKYRCNSTMVLGLMFYNLYMSQEGLLANKCCCDPYPGELFLFEATIDMPWMSALSEERGHTFKGLLLLLGISKRFHLLLPIS